MSQTKKLSIFISWSKRCSGDIAKEIKQWIEENVAQVSVFISHEIGAGEKWQRVIDDKLTNADMGIIVLTPENINSAWVLFEAGAIYNKDGKILPLLCGREAGKIEGPLKNLNYVDFSKKGIKKLLEQINTQLGLSMTDNAIKNSIEGTWANLEGKIAPLIEKSKIHIPSPEESGLKSEDQDHVDLAASKIFTVQEQIDIETHNVLNQSNMKVGDIPVLLKKYLNTEIPNKYKTPDKQKDGSIQTRFIINSTRISNFISFTDTKRIALFDRMAASLQMVENPNYDVFGAVTFENNSMFLKIKSDDFKSAQVKQVDEIPGFAFEDNINQYLETETVIMFGFSVVIAPNDLNLIVENCNQAIELWDLSSDTPKNTTAKARLAFNFSRRKYAK